MYLRAADFKVKGKTNGRSDGVTINTSGKEGCLLVSFRIWNEYYFDTSML